jgi:hypothetical protein
MWELRGHDGHDTYPPSQNRLFHLPKATSTAAANRRIAPASPQIFTSPSAMPLPRMWLVREALPLLRWGPNDLYRRGISWGYRQRLLPQLTGVTRRAFTEHSHPVPHCRVPRSGYARWSSRASRATSLADSRSPAWRSRGRSPVRKDARATQDRKTCREDLLLRCGHGGRHSPSSAQKRAVVRSDSRGGGCGFRCCRIRQRRSQR